MKEEQEYFIDTIIEQHASEIERHSEPIASPWRSLTDILAATQRGLDGNSESNSPIVRLTNSQGGDSYVVSPEMYRQLLNLMPQINTPLPHSSNAQMTYQGIPVIVSDLLEERKI